MDMSDTLTTREQQAASASATLPREQYSLKVLHDQVELAFEGQTRTQLVSLAVACIFVIIHASHGSSLPPLLGWLAILTVLLGIRIYSAHRYHSRREAGSWSNSKRWITRYRVLTALSATLWGLIGVLFYPPDHHLLQVFSVLVVAGLSAGALSVMTADFPAYRNFILLTLVPIGTIAMLRGEQLQVAIGGLIFILLIFLLRAGKATCRAVHESLQLRYENAELLADLEQEKNRLIHEAETMMGKVLSSAPIALWAIDREGVITFMDGNRLGQQTGLQLPVAGENLLEAFADQKSIIHETRRALAGETFVAEIEAYGHTYEVHYSPSTNDQQELDGAIGVAIDISERKRHEDELLHRANYDELTGLANRTLAQHELQNAFHRANRNQSDVTVYFLDLDNFKSINDTLGHNAGDQLLCQAADRLQKALRATDTAARLSGDEFLVIAENLNSQENAETLARKIVDTFQAPFLLDGRELFATTSVGIAFYPKNGDSAEQLLQCADTAMYHAKQSGRNAFRFFTPAMQQEAEQHLVIETELRRALQRRELELYYQPKVDLQTHCIKGAEALLRWHSKNLGDVRPDVFIPVAEMAGLMGEIGDWILHTACTEAAAWKTLSPTPVHVAINISPQQFRRANLQATVNNALLETGLPSELLELEITESLLVQDAPETLQTFNDLKAKGIRLALDDFGTGYSSLSYLRKFPLEVLKIDKSFVQDLGKDSESESLVVAIIAMAHSLHMDIVAEGVETTHQADYLAARGVSLVQGYLFSKPVNSREFRRMLTNNDGQCPSWSL